MAKHTSSEPSIISQLLSGYVQIESARLGGRLSNQSQIQAASLNDIPLSSNTNASINKGSAFKKPGMIVAGVVVGVVALFFVMRK